MSEITKSNRLKGIFFIILSAFGFAVMSAFIKLSGDLPNMQKVFFRNLVAAIIALFLIIKHRGSFTGKKENRKILIYRSIFGTIGVIFNYYAIDKLVLSDANMLNKISPFLVVIFCALILKEKINSKQILAIIVAFIGALFIIKPTFDVRVVPYMIGFLSAVFAALAYTFVRMLGNKEEYYTIVFFFSTFSLITVLPMFLMVYEPMTPVQFIYLILAGVFASLGQFGVTLAYKYAPAKEISIFDYSNIIFSAILSIFLFGVYPDSLSIVGYFIIFAAALYMFLYNKRQDKLRK
ncbi:MAG: DMT family transporter [Terrisporobacter othiniensis]|uniref:DMT family transporter n=2 Tax=Terrisporobacter TaxID=1505652 RepID=A0AAX2ZCM0_9FIRM|nr:MULTISPECIES: DMT family transporter [Terrisporobacter]MDU4859740.1 DMT family transporter [Terrisporobacter othiniensis]UPA29356.1 DMT family transporter [Terrisporobacter glycolicus]MDU6994091.1 DMT family transporter [Terrisporobacter othiniensis]UEL47019.1 DMT family transporter [Terrisporobacter hibernicus]HBI92227.1 EamA family transporter [Terrisporobacter hibernicus]